jgi:hypothetical protein
VIVLPVFPGEVTVLDIGLGSRYHARRIEWQGPGGTSGELELGEYAEVKLLATEDGVNAVWLNPPGPECRVHGPVGDDHFPCRVPGESAELFTARCLGEVRDV